MAVFFLFLRNVLLPIEILKIKILEHSDPPSQHFSVHKAFSHSFFCRGKVVLCHLAEWHTDLKFIVVYKLSCCLVVDVIPPTLDKLFDIWPHGLKNTRKRTHL